MKGNSVSQFNTNFRRGVLTLADEQCNGAKQGLCSDPHDVWLYERAYGSTQAGSDRHNDMPDHGGYLHVCARVCARTCV